MAIKRNLKSGDLLRYKPTARTQGWELHHPRYGYQIGKIYRIKEIDEQGYIMIDPKVTPSHLSNFEKIETDETSSLDISELPWPDITK